MKKFICFIFICSLSLGFVACGGDDDEEDNDKDKFTWNGDWNDPSDPNYKAEGYNPIQGLWKKTWDETSGIYFSEDFEVYTVIFYPNDGYTKKLWVDKYQINDKAYRFLPLAGDPGRYKVEGSTLILYPNLNNDEGAGYYIKMKE